MSLYSLWRDLNSSSGCYVFYKTKKSEKFSAAPPILLSKRQRHTWSISNYFPQSSFLCTVDRNVKHYIICVLTEGQAVGYAYVFARLSCYITVKNNNKSRWACGILSCQIFKLSIVSDIMTQKIVNYLCNTKHCFFTSHFCLRWWCDLSDGHINHWQKPKEMWFPFFFLGISLIFIFFFKKENGCCSTFLLKY